MLLVINSLLAPSFVEEITGDSSLKLRVRS
jgi:hypothetical protein